MATTTSRSARYAKWLSIPLGLVLSALLIWQASNAAFTSTVSSNGNSWTAAVIELKRTDDTAPLFQIPNLVPGDTESRTVTVDYTGTADATVSFYGTKFVNSPLANEIQLVIEGAAGPNFTGHTGEIFRGSLLKFANENPDFAGGIQYTATGSQAPQQGTFKFTYTLPSTVPNANTLQNQTTGIDLIVEAKSISRRG